MYLKCFLRFLGQMKCLRELLLKFTHYGLLVLPIFIPASKLSEEL